MTNLKGKISTDLYAQLDLALKRPDSQGALSDLIASQQETGLDDPKSHHNEMIDAITKIYDMDDSQQPPSDANKK